MRRNRLGGRESVGGNAGFGVEFCRINLSTVRCDPDNLRAEVIPEKRDQDRDADARADRPLFPPLGAPPAIRRSITPAWPWRDLFAREPLLDGPQLAHNDLRRCGAVIGRFR